MQRTKLVPRKSIPIAVAAILLIFLIILGIEGFPTTWLTTFGAVGSFSSPTR